MTLYDRILVPTDGSAGMDRVVSHAVALSRVHGAALHGIYVVNTGAYVGLPVEASWEGVDELLRADAEEAVTSFRERAAAADVTVETAVIEGVPHREIIRYAEEADCDLVVMGTHGRGGIDRLLLGSVAERVLRGCSVPVMTVRVGESADVDPEAATVD